MCWGHLQPLQAIEGGRECVLGQVGLRLGTSGARVGVAELLGRVCRMGLGVVLQAGPAGLGMRLCMCLLLLLQVVLLLHQLQQQLLLLPDQVLLSQRHLCLGSRDGGEWMWGCCRLAGSALAMRSPGNPEEVIQSLHSPVVSLVKQSAQQSDSRVRAQLLLSCWGSCRFSIF